MKLWADDCFVHDYSQGIRCSDKIRVLRDMLMAVYSDLNGVYQIDPDTNIIWSASQVIPSLQNLIPPTGTPPEFVDPFLMHLEILKY